jgi:hypothetical protein
MEKKNKVFDYEKIIENSINNDEYEEVQYS